MAATINILILAVTLLIIGGLLDLAYHTVQDLRAGQNGVTWAFLAFEVTFILSFLRPLVIAALALVGAEIEPLDSNIWRLVNSALVLIALVALRIALRKGNK